MRKFGIGFDKMGIIDEIKQRVDIVEVTSQYIPDLKKSGRNFKALCPFHPEKTPSFYVFPERQSWHCFGACGTGGDVFSFVMKKDKVDFAEALHILAQKTGVSLTQRQKTENQNETERLNEINETATEYFHQLLIHSSKAQKARSYLAQRDISEKSIEDFKLGFSLDSWEALRVELTNKGYREDEMISAGLLVEKDDGRTYDRFRNRLMFPIRDVSGRTLGFGGRALDTSLPKYLNSPQTAIFDKSNTLYGIDRAKSAIKKQNLAVLVEGYTDVLAAHQFGFENVIASLGTALTERQVGIIKKLTKNFILALDADAAGNIATLRGHEVIIQTFNKPMSEPGGSDVKYENLYEADWRVLILPQGKDPDDIIRENPEQWQQLLDRATPVIDYIFDFSTSKLDLTKIEDRSSAVDQLLPILNQIKDPVIQDHYLQKLARMVAVDESILRRLKPPSKPRRESNLAQPSTLIPSLSHSDPLAEYCLSLLIRYPNLRNYDIELSVDFFKHSENRELFLAWRETPDLESMRQRLDTTLREHFDTLLIKPLPPLSEIEQEHALHECVYRLRERWLKDLKAKEGWLISDIQSGGSTAELEELQQLGIKLNTQLREVFLQEREGKNKGRGV